MGSTFSGPGNYLIRIVGHLDSRWSERLGGLAVRELATNAEPNGPIVELSGYLADQAALYGVLNTLYDNRYPLLYVEYLGPAEG